jgi:NADH-quinone oxidoreductase subunit F
MEKILKRIAEGDGMPGDLELLESICSQIAGRTICFLGDSVAMPVRSFTTKFKDDFVQRILSGKAAVRPESERLNTQWHHG